MLEQEDILTRGPSYMSLHFTIHLHYLVLGDERGTVRDPITFNCKVEFRRPTASIRDYFTRKQHDPEMSTLECMNQLSQYGGATILTAIEMGGDYGLITVSSKCAPLESFSRKSGIFAAMLKLVNGRYPDSEGEAIWLTSWERVIREDTGFNGYHLHFSTPKTMRTFTPQNMPITSMRRYKGKLTQSEAALEDLERVLSGPFSDFGSLHSSVSRFLSSMKGSRKMPRQLTDNKPYVEKLGYYWFLNNGINHLPTVATMEAAKEEKKRAKEAGEEIAKGMSDEAKRAARAIRRMRKRAPGTVSVSEENIELPLATST